MKGQFRSVLLCASIMLLAPPPGLAQTAPCTQANALSVLVSGKTATAYVPSGAWSIDATGIRVVPLEGIKSGPSSISTPGYVDSCASDSITGQTVCTATDADVYLIKGKSLTKTLQSAANGFLGFSGGECENCGVAINALTNVAYIGEAVLGSAGYTVPAVQALDLNSNSFLDPLQLTNGLSESILVDPQRNEILSPTEASIYDIIQVDPETGRPTREFGYSGVSAEYDSSAEDCTTGFMIGTDEQTGNLFLANGDQVKFDKANDTWSDKSAQLVDFPQFSQLSAGTTGVEVAPGTHYAVLVGEFGGNVEGFLALPSKATLKKAALKDFVIATMPTDPNGDAFFNGYDPHSIATYTSLKSGKAYAVIADWATGAPDYLGVIDIAAMMAAPRVSGGYTNGKHVVDPTYDLIANKVLSYVRTY